MSNKTHSHELLPSVAEIEAMVQRERIGVMSKEDIHAMLQKKSISQWEQSILEIDSIPPDEEAYWDALIDTTLDPEIL